MISSVQVAKLKVHVPVVPGGIAPRVDTPIILQPVGAGHTITEHRAGGTGAGIITMGPGDAIPLQHIVN